MSKRTMMDQYMDISDAHPDSILFFRMGDFYEMFHDDAKVASETLGLTLTSRDKNSPQPIPMAGFPWHALEDNLRKMLRAGHKVCLCEQEDELRPGAKLLERVVTRVYTPGSLYEESLIGVDDSSVLCSLSFSSDTIGTAAFDVSTGDVWTAQYSGEDRIQRTIDEILRWSPDELVIPAKRHDSDVVRMIAQGITGLVISQHASSKSRSEDTVKSLLGVGDLGLLGLDETPLALEACNLAVDYLSSVHRTSEIPLRRVELSRDDSSMILDQTTLRNLELTHTLAGEKDGALLSTMNACRTAMGRRRLKAWITRPLANISQIEARHDAVFNLQRSSRRLSDIREVMNGLRDLERLATRLAYGRANGRDLLAIADALQRMPRLQSLCLDAGGELIEVLSDGLSNLEEMHDSIAMTLLDEQPLSIKDGGLIRPGINGDLDILRQRSKKGNDWFKEQESKLRKELEIPSLKIKHNRQIGWYIEVTKTHLDKVPEQWIRKQEMTNGSRFITEELKTWEEDLLSADTRANALEYDIFIKLRSNCSAAVDELGELAYRLSCIDVLQCFAEISRRRGWSRPKLSDDRRFDVINARHPILEAEPGFVANDIEVDEKRRFLLITGPNMGGKSTYLRTVALICILAQAGSFVPAERARIGVVDRIFTRVGASDDLKRGRSTFMMEMIEVAHILSHAEQRSLVLLDEVGRGTSTFDGLSIAWAVTEDICTRIGCRALFATHYHQLVGLETEVVGIKNIHVQVSGNESGLKFLHTVADGPCDESYGVQVAALAGLPRHVVERAGDLLGFLESRSKEAKAGKSGVPGRRNVGQSSLMGFSQPASKDVKAERLKSTLSQIDPDALSPREALEELYRLKKVMDE